ncbi:MAG TPA: TetR/AcrR family transcriptional regulator [Baekduia sp.]|nr:TetR/AcrR family transcriptional regulator [Baekduia sp.]
MTPTESGIGKRRKAALVEGSDEYNARRQELIHAAAAVFNEKGYEAATLNDIAERVGADRASLYYYVGSKQELFQDAVRDVLDGNLKHAERIARRSGAPAEKLAELVRQIILSYIENYPHTYVYIQEDMRRVASDDSDWAQDMTRKSRRIESITIKLIEQGIKKGDLRGDIRPDVAARALWGMINWTHRWYKPSGDLSGEELAHQFSEIFFSGLRG